MSGFGSQLLLDLIAGIRHLGLPLQHLLPYRCRILRLRNALKRAMHDVLVMLLEVLGRRVDGCSGENLHIVRGDGFARGPRGPADLTAGGIGRSGLRGGCCVASHLQARSLLVHFDSVFDLGYLRHDAGFVAETGRRRRDGGRRAGRGASIAVLVCLHRDVGEGRGCRSG